MANTKIEAYKFVSPAAGRAMGGAVASARVTTMAINRLGGTITSIAKATKDIERIAAASQKLERKQEVLERRRLRKEGDRARRQFKRNLGNLQDMKLENTYADLQNKF